MVTFMISQLIIVQLKKNIYLVFIIDYPFMANLDRCNGSCNTLVDRSATICVSNKTENVNLNVFNMITRINESKTLPRHISCDCKCH